MAHGRRILVVDDCTDTIEIVCTMLRMLGHDANGVDTAGAALRELAGAPADIVLLDLELVVESGAALAREIRRRYGRVPTLIALTGWNLDDPRHATMRAEFDDFVLKPARFELLQTLIQRHGVQDVPPKPLAEAGQSAR